MRENRKIKEGIVVSDKMAKTVVVLVERKICHPLYQKVIRITKKFKVHDENKICSVGDRVRIMETRPLSADKRWNILEVIEKGKEKVEEEDKGKPALVRRERETVGDTKQV